MNNDYIELDLLTKNTSKQMYFLIFLLIPSIQIDDIQST